ATKNRLGSAQSAATPAARVRRCKTGVAIAFGGALDNATGVRRLLAFAIIALGFTSCGGSPPQDCEPTTIVVHGKCFFEKDRACDEIGCLPPNQCVELDTSPPSVECRKR